MHIINIKKMRLSSASRSGPEVTCKDQAASNGLKPTVNTCIYHDIAYSDMQPWARTAARRPTALPRSIQPSSLL